MFGKLTISAANGNIKDISALTDIDTVMGGLPPNLLANSPAGTCKITYPQKNEDKITDCML